LRSGRPKLVVYAGKIILEAAHGACKLFRGHHIIYKQGQRSKPSLDLVASIDAGIVIFRYHFVLPGFRWQIIFGSSEAANKNRFSRELLERSDDQV